MPADILKYWQPNASDESPEQSPQQYALDSPKALSAGLSALKIPGAFSFAVIQLSSEEESFR